MGKKNKTNAQEDASVAENSGHAAEAVAASKDNDAAMEHVAVKPSKAHKKKKKSKETAEENIEEVSEKPAVLETEQGREKKKKKKRKLEGDEIGPEGDCKHSKSKKQKVNQDLSNQEDTESSKDAAVVSSNNEMLPDVKERKKSKKKKKQVKTSDEESEAVVVTQTHEDAGDGVKSKKKKKKKSKCCEGVTAVGDVVINVAEDDCATVSTEKVKKKKKSGTKTLIEAEEHMQCESEAHDVNHSSCSVEDTLQQKEKKKKKKEKKREKSETSESQEETGTQDTQDNGEIIKEKKKKAKKRKMDETENGGEERLTSVTETDHHKVKKVKKSKKKEKTGEPDESRDQSEAHNDDDFAKDNAEEPATKHKKKRKKDKKDKEDNGVKDENKDSVEIADDTKHYSNHNNNYSNTNLPSANGAEEEERKTERSQAVSVGQWSTDNMFQDNDRQTKFLRLLGGFKKSGSLSSVAGQKKGLYGSLQLKQESGSGGGQRALTHEAARQMDMRLESDFERALAFRVNGQRGGGLGFTPDPAEGKKFHINVNKVASKKF